MSQEDTNSLKNKIKPQITLRFREEEVNHIRENINYFEFPEDIRIADMWLQIFDVALNKNPKQSLEADLKQIKELEEKNKNLEVFVETLKVENESLKEVIGANESVITLNFDEKTKEEFCGIVEVGKKTGIIKSVEGMVTLMLRIFQKHGYFVLSESDKNYLKSLKQTV